MLQKFSSPQWVPTGNGLVPSGNKALPVLPLYTFFKVLYFIWTILHFYTLFILFFFKEKAWNTFFLLYWKDFTSIFQDGDSRPYWVLLPSKIEEWSQLVNLLVRSPCTLALRMELESSSDTVASKVYIVIWNKVTLGEYLCVENTFFYTLFGKQRYFLGVI